MIIRSIAHRNAARVLPEPVGAWINVSLPVCIEAQPCDWAGVGVANTLLNQDDVATENRPVSITMFVWL